MWLSLSLLKHFLIKLIEIEVDILIGWNSDSFDIPYLYVRSKLLFGSEFIKLLSPIGIVKESFDFNPQNPIQIYGVESIDFMRIHKSYIPISFLSLGESYSLN